MPQSVSKREQVVAVGRTGIKQRQNGANRLVEEIVQIEAKTLRGADKIVCRIVYSCQRTAVATRILDRASWFAFRVAEQHCRTGDLREAL
jgi:hypothetical protein